MSGAGPFWGPSGGPRIGSADTNSIVVGSPCDKLFDALRSRNLCGCGAGRKMCKGRGLLECENVPALIFPFETNEIKTMRSTHALVVRMPFILLPSQSRMVGNWQCEFVYGVMDVLNRCVCQMPLDFWFLCRKQCKNCCALRAPGHFLCKLGIFIHKFWPASFLHHLHRLHTKYTKTYPRNTRTRILRVHSSQQPFGNRFEMGSVWWTRIWCSWGVHQLLVDIECGPFLGPESGPQIGTLLHLGVVT